MTHEEAMTILRSKEIDIMGKPYAVWKFLEALRYALDVLDQTSWRDPAIEVPCDPDVFVLVCVSGTCGGIRMEHAYELATYNQEDGWCLEWDDGVSYLDVHGWMPIMECKRGMGGDNA